MDLSQLPVPPKNNQTGYKHWTARSGTLIANMITAAGKIDNFVIYIYINVKKQTKLIGYLFLFS